MTSTLNNISFGHKIMLIRYKLRNDEYFEYSNMRCSAAVTLAIRCRYKDGFHTHLLLNTLSIRDELTIGASDQFNVLIGAHLYEHDTYARNCRCYRNEYNSKRVIRVPERRCARTPTTSRLSYACTCGQRSIGHPKTCAHRIL